MFPVSIARMAKIDTSYQAFLSWRFPYYALPNLAIWHSSTLVRSRDYGLVRRSSARGLGGGSITLILDDHIKGMKKRLGHDM
jgi:hypothetical protein